MDQGVVEKFGDARLIVHDQYSDERSGQGSGRMEGYAALDLTSSRANPDPAGCG
jgi:hypothetical protein